MEREVERKSPVEFELSERLPQGESSAQGDKFEQLSAPGKLVRRGQLPFVFDPGYDIDLPQIFHAQPFDFEKRGKVQARICERFALEAEQLFTPPELDREILELVHSPEYLDSIRSSQAIARIMGLSQLESYDFAELDQKLMEPLRRAVSGTLLGASLAMEYGWGVNLSGGFHHAAPNQGGGFCFYNDIALAFHHLRREKLARKIMVIDLDAHQGDGTAYCLGNEEDCYLVDIFNRDIFPRDSQALQLVDTKLGLSSGCRDDEYLSSLFAVLDLAFSEFHPDIIIYNAGADIHHNDMLGQMKVSEAGVAKRDWIVFEHARLREIPILMLLSGAYASTAAGVISSGIYSATHDKVRTLLKQSKESQ